MAEHPRSPAPSAAGPVLAPLGASAAEASHPDTLLDGRYHIYESNPAPWWIGALWAAYLIFGVTYLIVNLLE
jgi:hypothetical protein